MFTSDLPRTRCATLNSVMLLKGDPRSSDIVTLINIMATLVAGPKAYVSPEIKDVYHRFFESFDEKDLNLTRGVETLN